MSAKVFARRLTQLEAILSKTPDAEYNHHCYSTCAIGHAIKNRKIFRGLNLNVTGVALYTDAGALVSFNPEPYTNGYFGPNAFNEVFGTPLNVSREGVIKRIQTFRDKLLSESA